MSNKRPSARLLARLAIVAAGLAGCAAAYAEVTVDGPWVRATVAGLKDTGAFMKLSSPTAARLVKADSPAAAHVELHESVVVDNVMKMRPIGSIGIPAGQPVDLKPGGLHVMLIGVKAPLKDGDQVPLTLVFDVDGKQQTVTLTAPVKPLNVEMKMPMK